MIFTRDNRYITEQVRFRQPGTASLQKTLSNITARPPQRRALPATAGEFAFACKSLQQQIDLLKARFLDREPIELLLPDLEEFALRARRLVDHAKHKIQESR